MCTVTFIARKHGYALGMNRDEKLTRPTALPPAKRVLGGGETLFPSEPSGGTWIGVNAAGVTYALINWYSITARARDQVASRGDVVPALLPFDSIEEAALALSSLPLERINPFRLIAILPKEKGVVEWRWNLKLLERVDHSWRTGIWISSGFDEPGAQQTRGKAFGEAMRQASAGSVDWLRRLHRSHGPERGPYSTCMHRADAATVSYTEIAVRSGVATMRYLSGAPCCGSHQNPSPQDLSPFSDRL